MPTLDDSISDLTSLSAGAVAEGVRAREFSARDVVGACIRRIEEFDGGINAVIVRRFSEALAEADAVDAAVREGREVGPLAGVPVTVKECFHVSGTPATMGVPALAGKISREDARLVKRLRDAGAVILGKTNVPQLMVLHETDNPLYGRTNNPWRRDRVPGGSSGGEAAAIAAGFSAVGLGSDLGGSIRLPAHFCGIHGLKPTTGRLITTGALQNFPGFEAISGQPGPLARSVADLEISLAALALPWCRHDPRVHPVPLRSSEKVDVSRLRVGIWTDDGYFPCAPALRRAVDEAAGVLRTVGADVEPFQPPGVREAIRIYYGLLSADGTANLRRNLAGSRPDRRVARLLRLGGISSRMRSTLGWWLLRRGQSRLADLVLHSGALSADRYWQLCHRKELFVRKFLESWAARRFDVLVSPPHALPALTHGTSADLTTAASYCLLVNLLEVPAGVVAATRVRRQEESDRPNSRDQVERTAKRVEMGSAGLPVGVQVASWHWREDRVLAVMRVLEEHFRSRPEYPATPVQPPG